MLRTFGLSLIGIFLPIYLFKSQLPFIFSSDTFVNSIYVICIFFLLESVFTLLFIFIFSEWVFKFVPFQKILLISNLVLIGALMGLYNLEAYPVLYFVTPMLLGFVITSYWIPYHLFFMEKNGDKEGHYGKKLGLSHFLGRAVNALGPLLGGFILTFFGFPTLFVFASLLILISSIPIMLEIKDTKHHIDSPWEIIKHYLINKKYKFTSIGFFGISTDFIVFSFFWPLVLLFTLEDFSKIGTLTFVTMLASATLALFTGKLIDKKDNRRIHLIGVVAAVFFHFFRIFTKLPIYIYTLDLLDKMNFAFFDLPLVAKTYEIGKGEDDADFVIYREIALHFFRLFIIVLIMVLIAVLPNWKYIFVVAAIGSALSFFISFQKTD